MNILIGVQARCDSVRLPNKVLMYIGNKQMLQHIIEKCEHAIKYLKSHKLTAGCNLKLAILCPQGDKILGLYGDKYTVIGGHPVDCLNRYSTAAENFNADLIVRITADCFWLPSHLIAKHVRSAVIKGMDYTTNVLCRMWPEGFDVQVVTRRLLDWVDTHTEGVAMREHVFPILEPSSKVKFPFADKFHRESICHILNERYEADQKTSIDTMEEMEHTRELFAKFVSCNEFARKNGIACL